MPRELGGIIPMGGIAPFGADCDETCKDGACDPDNLTELSQQIRRDCDQSGDSAGTPPACQDLQDASRALAVLSQFANLAGQGISAYSQQQMQNSFREGSGQMREGQNQMLENGQALNDATNDYLSNASQYQNLATQLGDIQGAMTASQSVMNATSSAISSLNTQIAQSQQSLADANARLDYARNPANYPRTTAGMRQQRADFQSANTAVRDSSLALNTQQTQLQTATTDYNNASSAYNTARSQGEVASAQAQQTQAQASEAQQRAERAQAGVQAGQQRYVQGAGTIRNGLERNRDIQQNVVIPTLEGASGARGVSQVLDHASRAEYYEGAGDAFASGYGSYARMSGNPALVNATGLVSAGVISAGRAIDQGGTFEQMGQRFVEDFGQATLRTSDINRIADHVELADCILNNPNNPNRVYDATTMLNSQFGASVNVVGGILQTFAPFVPGGQAISPALPFVSNALGTLGQGLTQTVIEATNTAWRQGGLSAPVGTYPPRDIGRGLVQRERGGPPSYGTVMIAGSTATLGEMSYSIVNTGIGGNANNASRASSIVSQVARTGATPPLRTGDISLRPPVAVPVYAGD